MQSQHTQRRQVKAATLLRLTRSTVAMDTLVTARVASARPLHEAKAAIGRAFTWFGAVEQRCSRFDPESELIQLCRAPGRPVQVSPLLFAAIRMALEVAAASRGAFDPTIGAEQQARGFNRNYLSGAVVSVAAGAASYHDVHLDRAARTVLLRRPLLLDLGAVAKGLAVDLAARELADFERFMIEAGGDLYAGGAARSGKAWRVGVQDPTTTDRLLGVLHVWNRAVCTSGSYERTRADGSHHLLDPQSGKSATAAVAVTTVTTTAMVADALATAAFVLGAEQGLPLLRDHDVEGLIVAPTNEICATPGLSRKYHWQASTGAQPGVEGTPFLPAETS